MVTQKKRRRIFYVGISMTTDLQQIAAAGCVYLIILPLKIKNTRIFYTFLYKNYLVVKKEYASDIDSVLSTNLRLFQIWSFFCHDIRQQLVFQALSCDGEVDEGSLCLHFRLVVRIGQLRLQDQSEVRMVFNLLVAELDVSGEEN